MIGHTNSGTAAELTASRRLQEDFFGRLNDQEPLRRLFDHIPGLRFFVKDRQGRLASINEFYALRRGAPWAERLLGLSDWQIHPPLIARRLREDDGLILADQTTFRRPLELLFQDGSGRMDWGRTIKLPMVDPAGVSFGILGVSRPSPPPSSVQGCLKSFQAATRLILRERQRPFSLDSLTERTGIPARRLQSLIQDAYGVSVRELSLQARFLAALSALRQESCSVGDIAVDHGFVDQSAFTRQWRRLTGLTPGQIRSEKWRPR